MRALTLTQPWAGLVASGIKLIENRPRNAVPAEVRAGEPFAIHASRRIDESVYRRIHEIAPELFHWGEASGPWSKLSRITSAVIGIASYRGTVTDRVIDEPWHDLGNDQWRWLFGPFGHVLRDVVALKTAVPCKGKLGFWTLDADVELAVREQLKGAA